MLHLTEAILPHGAGLSEGGAISAKGLLELGARPAVDQALSADAIVQLGEARPRLPGRLAVLISRLAFGG